MPSQSIDGDSHRLHKLFENYLTRMHRREQLSVRHHTPLLMIVDNLNVLRIAIFPDEAYPPFVIDPDAVLSRALSLQRFETVAGDTRRSRISPARCRSSNFLRALRSKARNRITSLSKPSCLLWPSYELEFTNDDFRFLAVGRRVPGDQPKIDACVFASCLWDALRKGMFGDDTIRCRWRATATS